MQRLSSPSTFFYKRVFPVFWFGFLAVWTVGWTCGSLLTHNLMMLAALPGPVIMALFGFWLFKTLLFDLVDEVWLDGNQLVVKCRDESSRIDLANVINVNASAMTSPPRITLTLRTGSPRLGKAVAFIPAGRNGLFAMFKPNPIASGLIEHIDALRGRPA
jgi:hypothetical protein